MKPSTWVLALAPSASVALVFALVWDRVPPAEARAAESTFWDATVVEFVRDRVSAMYVDELSREKTTEMFYAALDAYLAPLDPYSDFLTPEEMRHFTEHHSGHYAGLGIQIRAQPEGLRVAGVLPGGPAAKAGLRIGEIVASADGRSLAGVDTSDRTIQLLKGPAGSRVLLTVLGLPTGDGAEPARPSREVAVVREEIQPPTVRSRRVGPDGRYAHVRITEFVDTTDEEFDQDVDRHVAEGVKGVILDLRGNTGGVFDATVGVADRFLRSGDICRTVGRARGTAQVHAAKDAGTIPDSVALVVLVDGHSASGSELLAGALQDHRRGVLLGTRTHGKFLVQSTLAIPGKRAGLKLTTSRYVTPLGRWFKRTSRNLDVPEGLLPDIVVELPDDEAARLEKARDDEDARVWGKEPEHPELAEGWVDPQVRRAVEVLDGTFVLPEIRRERPSRG